MIIVFKKNILKKPLCFFFILIFGSLILTGQLAIAESPKITATANLAKEGHADAQYKLAIAYYYGNGVPESSKEAIKWFVKAAEQGHIRSQLNLGVAYANGDGVPSDQKEAVRWYRKAANQGDAEAQYNLGVMYREGRGVSQNHGEAVRWFRIAAKQRLMNAQYNLGVAYMEGNGVDRNPSEAMQWFRLAAEQGYPEAQYNLGLGYYKGIGLPSNLTDGLNWLRKSAEQDYDKAILALSTLGHSLLDTVNLCELQESLAELGFYNSQIDGLTGIETSSAIENYEQNNKMKTVGLASKQILLNVRSRIKKHSKQPKELSREITGVTPENGVFFNKFKANGIAPLQISTPNKGVHFYVKVQRNNEPDDYAAFFIQSGQIVNIDVPLGAYLIKYAVGSQWFSERCLFGVRTMFNKADKVFTFKKEGNKVSGYKVELILQIDGNLSTSRIERKDF